MLPSLTNIIWLQTRGRGRCEILLHSNPDQTCQANLILIPQERDKGNKVLWSARSLVIYRKMVLLLFISDRRAGSLRLATFVISLALALGWVVIFIVAHLWLFEYLILWYSLHSFLFEVPIELAASNQFNYRHLVKVVALVAKTWLLKANFDGQL